MQYYANTTDLRKLEMLVDEARKARDLARHVVASGPGAPRDSAQVSYEEHILRIRLIVVDL